MNEYRLKCQQEFYQKYKEKLLNEIKRHPFDTFYDIVVDCKHTPIGQEHDHTATNQLEDMFKQDGYQVEVIYNHLTFYSVADLLRIILG